MRTSGGPTFPWVGAYFGLEEPMSRVCHRIVNFLWILSARWPSVPASER